MPAYEEKEQHGAAGVMLLLIAAIAIYQPFFLGSWELRGREDRYAAIALEMNALSPDTVAHGQLVPFNYPLYPWLVNLILKTGFPIELSLRLVSIVSMLLVSVLIWEAGRRACDKQTALVGTAFYISTTLVVEKSMNGSPYFTSILFVFAAWLAWFTYGVARGKWSLAWIVSFFFCALGFFTDGWTAVFMFLFPLIFMRRPMTVWPKLKKPGFFLGGAVLLALILIWVLPHWVLDNQMPFQGLSNLTNSISSYLNHLWTYPFEVALRLLPWSLLAWPAFCVAYFPLLKNQMFSRFLRTIVISLFIFFWLAPTNTAKVIGYIIPPLAVLCGINYWLLIRRHGHQIHNLFRILSLAAAAFALLGVAFYLLPDAWLSLAQSAIGDLSFRKSNSIFIFGICESTMAFCLALTAFFLSRKSLRVYAHVLMFSVSISMIFWALHIPYRAVQTTKKDLGAKLAATLREDLKLPDDTPLPSDLVVYKGPHILGLYGPCIYMGAKVRKIRSMKSLPDSADTVYMIATQFPVSKKRIWEYVPSKENPLIYKKTKLYLLKGRNVNSEKSKTLGESHLPQ